MNMKSNDKLKSAQEACNDNLITDRNDAVGSNNPTQPQRLPLPPAPNFGQLPDIDVGDTGIPVELLQIIRQLRHINNWFYEYAEIHAYYGVFNDTSEIESALGGIVGCISNLAALELLEAHYYGVKSQP